MTNSVDWRNGDSRGGSRNLAQNLGSRTELPPCGFRPLMSGRRIETAYTDVVKLDLLGHPQSKWITKANRPKFELKFAKR